MSVIFHVRSYSIYNIYLYLLLWHPQDLISLLYWQPLIFCYSYWLFVWTPIRNLSFDTCSNYFKTRIIKVAALKVPVYWAFVKFQIVVDTFTWLDGMIHGQEFSYSYLLLYLHSPSYVHAMLQCFPIFIINA